MPDHAKALEYAQRFVNDIAKARGYEAKDLSDYEQAVADLVPYFNAAMAQARQEQHEASWKAAIEAAANEVGRPLSKEEWDLNWTTAQFIRALPCPPLPIEPQEKAGGVGDVL